jgi:hypothetical protein
MALALGKLNFSCAVIGLTFINRTCQQRTGTPKFRGSGCQFPQSQCHPSPRTGIALGINVSMNYDWFATGPVGFLETLHHHFFNFIDERYFNVTLSSSSKFNNKH